MELLPAVFVNANWRLELAWDLPFPLRYQGRHRERVDTLADEFHGPVSHQEVATTVVERVEPVPTEVRAVDRARSPVRLVGAVVQRSLQPVLAVESVSPSAAIGGCEKIGPVVEDRLFVVDRAASRPLAEHERVRWPVGYRCNFLDVRPSRD